MKRRNGFMMLFGLALILALSACAGTPPVKDSGFLGGEDVYAKLQAPKNKDRVADKIWVDPTADLSKYNKIMLDEVVFYLKNDSESKAVHPEDIKELTKAYHEAFIKEMENKYPLVTTPGPDVLRVRVAIVDIVPSNRALDTITTVLPVGLAVSLVKSGTTGAGTGVGQASMEFELLDSVTGQVLAMGRDTYIGSKLNMEAKVAKWGYTEAAFEYWAKHLVKGLDAIKAGKYSLDKKE